MTHKGLILWVVIALGAVPAVCAQPSRAATASLELSLARAWPAEAQDPPEPPAAASAKEKPSFGAGNSWRWYAQGAWAVDVKSFDNQFVLLGGGIEFFMIDFLSLSLELNGMYFIQESGDDALGINFALLFRWHFLVFEKWTVYADGGAGLLGTTEDVPGPQPAEPRGGTKFNFTPQAGLGFTYAISDTMRLMGGFRWYHISNANSQENNPGRDSIMLYLGVSLPF